MAEKNFIDEKYDAQAISLIPFCELHSDFLKYTQWPVFTPCAFCPSLSGAACVDCATKYSSSLVGAISCSDMNSLCNRRRCRFIIKEVNKDFAVRYPRTYFSLGLSCDNCGGKDCQCKELALKEYDCVECGNALTKKDKGVTCANQGCPKTNTSSEKFNRDLIPLVCDRCIARKHKGKPWTCLGKCRTMFNVSVDCYFPFKAVATKFADYDVCIKCKQSITKDSYMPCHNLNCAKPTCRDCHIAFPELMWCSSACMLACKTNGKTPYLDRFSFCEKYPTPIIAKVNKTRSGTAIRSAEDEAMICASVKMCDACRQIPFSHDKLRLSYLDGFCLHWRHRSDKFRATGQVCSSCFCAFTRCYDCTVSLIEAKRQIIHYHLIDEYELVVKPLNVLRLRITQLEFFDFVLLAAYLCNQGFFKRSDANVLEMILHSIDTLVFVLDIDAKQNWNVLNLKMSSYFEACLPLVHLISSSLPKNYSGNTVHAAPNLAALHITNHFTILYSRFSSKEEAVIMARVAGLVLDPETKCSRLYLAFKKAEVDGKLSVANFRIAVSAEYNNTNKRGALEETPGSMHNRKRLRPAFQQQESSSS